MKDDWLVKNFAFNIIFLPNFIQEMQQSLTASMLVLKQLEMNNWTKPFMRTDKCQGGSY